MVIRIRRLLIGTLTTRDVAEKSFLQAQLVRHILQMVGSHAWDRVKGM